MRKDFFATKVKSMFIIAPEKSLIEKIVKALNLIKKVDRREYRKLFSRINLIFVTRMNNSTNEFFMPAKYWFTNKVQIKHTSINWVASSLLHEGFHATQFKNGKWASSFEEVIEKPAIEFEIKFLKKVKDQKEIDWLKHSLKEKLWLRIWKDKKSHTYFRNLWKLLHENKLAFTYIRSKK